MRTKRFRQPGGLPAVRLWSRWSAWSAILGIVRPARGETHTLVHTVVLAVARSRDPQAGNGSAKIAAERLFTAAILRAVIAPGLPRRPQIVDTNLLVAADAAAIAHEG